jgi:hypothetical protein
VALEGWPSGKITLELKRDLAEYFRQCGASAVRFSDREKENAEFMIDLCAFAERRMDTAVESEWTPRLECIHYDFEKLLYVNAPMKVMVCDSPDYVRTRLEAAKKFLSNQYCNYTPDETYMIVNYRGNRAVVNCHIWKPPQKSVSPEEIKFHCLAGFPAPVSESVPQPNDGWLGDVD